MDTRIKTGDNLKCDYSGIICPTVIKIYSEIDERETGWISLEALKKTCDFLTKSSENELEIPKKKHTEVSDFEKNCMQMRDDESKKELQRQEDKPHSERTQGINPKISKSVVENFSKAVKDLQENPPPRTMDSENGSIPEFAIKDLIKKFLPLFGENKNQMFSPLRKAFQLDPVRFKMLLEGMK